MSIRRVLAGALFVVLAFSAGIGLNLLKRATPVLAAPPSSLTSVAHDATLTGLGTTSVPLGVAGSGIGTGQIANGAVTLPKLGISGSPAAGNLLGYSGSGLAWQNPGTGGGVRVVDSMGHSYPFDVNSRSAIWQTPVGAFLIPLAVNGVYPNCCVQVYYSSFDCSPSGQVYYGVSAIDPNALIGGPAMIDSNVVYYTTTVPQIVSFNSHGDLQRTVCTVATGTVYGASSSFSTLSLTSDFVPPFHLEVN